MRLSTKQATNYKVGLGLFTLFPIYFVIAGFCAHLYYADQLSGLVVLLELIAQTVALILASVWWPKVVPARVSLCLGILSWIFGLWMLASFL
jgi:hypothetical protein